MGIFFSRLTNEQKHILQIISDKQRVSAKHTQQSELAEYAQEHHLLLEVVLEQINEIALECIEDTIIDTAENPVYIY